MNFFELWLSELHYSAYINYSCTNPKLWLFLYSGRKGGGQGGQRKGPRLTYLECPLWSLRGYHHSKRRSLCLKNLKILAKSSGVNSQLLFEYCIQVKPRYSKFIWQIQISMAFYLPLITTLNLFTQAYLLQLKIEEASWRLRSGDLGIPPNPEDRFTPKENFSHTSKHMSSTCYASGTSGSTNVLLKVSKSWANLRRNGEKAEHSRCQVLKRNFKAKEKYEKKNNQSVNLLPSRKRAELEKSRHDAIVEMLARFFWI